MIKKATRKYF